MKKILIGVCILAFAGNSSIATAKNMHSKKDNMKLDKKLRAIIHSNSLTGNPLSDSVIPDINSPKVQLGMDLFYSKSLGGNRDSACVSCHHPVLGGGDNLSLPIGVEADNPDLLGEGRTNYDAESYISGSPPVPRNAPTTFNIAAWRKFMFHDGRVERLEKNPGKNATDPGIRTPNSEFGVADPLAGENIVQAQARFPITSREEMKGFYHDNYDDQAIREYLADRLAGYDNSEDNMKLNDADTARWLAKFQDAFPDNDSADLITEQNISMLIAEYERSQAFVETPWKRYVEGDNRAISESAKKGALLFYRSAVQGGVNCSSCHSGDFFTDEKFHNLAMPQIGPGKGDGENGSEDYGRFRETGKEKDKFAFRTPTLLNVEVTGPWSHAGAYTTLEAIVRHHLDTEVAIDFYDVSQLTTKLEIQNLDLVEANTRKAFNASSFALKKPVDLTDRQVNHLVSFLKTLTDPCTKDRSCLSKWIPDGLDPSDDQLNAIDQNFEPL